MSIISGKAHWAKLDKASNPFDETKLKYSLDLALDEEGAKEMASQGFNIKNKDDVRGDFVMIYKYEQTSKGQMLPKPRVFDASKNIVHGTLIGNGSEVNVSYNKRDYNVGGNKGSRPELRDVQIIKLVEYSPPDEFAKTEGYIAPVTADEEAVVINEEDEIPFVS